MSYQAAFEISASGMAVEKLRLDLTAANLANMNQAAPSAGAVYQPLRLVSQARPLEFARQMALAGGGAEVKAVLPQAVAARMAYEPGHPYADAKGMVAYPGIDHTAEMLNVNLALRSYEANLAAFTAARTMAARTLDIGGNQ
jgi:flagellar basal-body rod protein FlgC